MYDGLCAKYRFASFYGRDDYNVEHIFRSRAIRAQGGRSLGISHGTSYFPLVEPVWRYIDFDVYYVFGRDIIEKYYRSKWPTGVEIKAVGTLVMTRDMLPRIGGQYSPDIVVYMKPWLDGAGFLADVFTLARAFPDRTVYIKVKPNSEYKFSASSFEDDLEARPKNIVPTVEDSYELSLKHRYSVQGASTMVFESIQLGQVVFCLDHYAEDMPYQYREYPELNHRSIDAIIERIRGIEAGTWTYPRDAYKGLVDVEGDNLFEIIRADIGLPHRPSVKGRAV